MSKGIMAHDLLHGLLYLVASAYGSGGYGEESYGGGPLDFLANTGWDVLIPLFLGISLIVAGLVMVARRLARRRQARRSKAEE